MSSGAPSIAARAGVAYERLTGYLELTKPRVLTMVLITALAGFYMGSAAEFDFILALKLLLGTALAAGGTLALNEYFEREFDARMERTRNRPLPSGRLRPPEALAFGLAAGSVGIVYLYTLVNPLAAAVTGAITLLYLGAYTPMKRYSWFCHIVGGVPGALPPVIGWAAARGTLSAEPFILFGIMLLWQLPHSLSIARIYQADYARAGLSLLPPDGPYGNPANAVMLTATAVLVLFGTLPTWMGFAGWFYLTVAVVLGSWMLYRAIRLVRIDMTAAAARSVMMVSLVYLPIILLVMVLDKA
ncbi:MAG TPA: heme o synthase [Candidatus Binataceae bacterium]|nr:heme o synthase [Candidatus Binataceae bacterium]